MEKAKSEQKTIELWPGKVVPVTREELLKDYDYIADLTKAAKANDLSTLANMLFVLIGGEETFDELRRHIIEEKGVFDINEVARVTKQLFSLFPKASSSSSKRW